MLEALKQAAQFPWMGTYLRLLSILIAYGASVHFANLIGLGEKTWQEAPLAWKIGDIFYLFVDSLTAIGLWQRTTWGIICFFSAIASQLVIYTIFIDNFALTVNHRQTIYGLLATEAILVFTWVILFLAKK